MKNVTIKETAKSKETLTNLRKVVKEAKEKKNGTIFGISFKTIGKNIILF